MTSQLNVDTIVDKAGSGGTNVKMANNAVTVSEGGNATTNTVQGLCKTWCVYVGDGSAISDSFNTASLTDNATGDATIAHTNDMSSGNYHHSGSVVYTAGDDLDAMGQLDTQDGSGRRAASTHRVIARYNGANANDVDADFGLNSLGTFGDLA